MASHEPAGQSIAAVDRRGLFGREERVVEVRDEDVADLGRSLGLSVPNRIRSRGTTVVIVDGAAGLLKRTVSPAQR
jgi:hypothetical protein